MGLLLSCPPYCQSALTHPALTHPAFISVSPQGDLGRTQDLLSLLQVSVLMSKFIRFPLLTVSFPHSIAFYLPIHPFAYSPGSYYFYFALKFSDYSFFFFLHNHLSIFLFSTVFVIRVALPLTIHLQLNAFFIIPEGSHIEPQHYCQLK